MLTSTDKSGKIFWKQIIRKVIQRLGGGFSKLKGLTLGQIYIFSNGHLLEESCGSVHNLGIGHQTISCKRYVL
jgi:hypothetical protein